MGRPFGLVRGGEELFGAFVGGEEEEADDDSDGKDDAGVVARFHHEDHQGDEKNSNRFSDHAHAFRPFLSL